MPPALSASAAALSTLNEAQRRAVQSEAATVAILAGPGSGKTHTLTSRVVWLIEHVGYAPQDILVATFTVKAAREMKDRIGKALGNGKETKLVLGTFHSIARRYLAAYGHKIGVNQKFSIADDADSRAIIARLHKRLALSLDPAVIRAWISKKKAKGSVVGAPSKGRPKDLPESPELQTCYAEYQAHLERSNLLDYDDLLVRAVELLRKFPSCVSNIQAVLIDEYQDTNGTQYELMKLLAQQHRRITIVGDPDQSIYGWRSAEQKNLWRMLQDFPNTHEVSLEENYRSSQLIVDLALRVIQQDTNRYQKLLRPTHARGARPVLRRLKSPSAEAEWIVSEMRRCLMMTGGMMTHNDVAILLRSASLSRHIESALGRAGVAYKMVGGFKFYERAEIKIILDYLRVIQQPGNNDAVARVINVPRRGVGDGTIKSLLEEAEKSGISLWTLLTRHCRGDRQAKTRLTKQAEQKISGEFIRPLSTIQNKLEQPNQGSTAPFGLEEVVESVLSHLRFEKFLQETYAEDHEQRWANVQEFLGMAAEFDKDTGRMDEESLPQIEDLEQAEELAALPRFLANVALASDVDRTDGTADKPKPQVTISTIHAAKGLEWPVVFIPSTYNGSIPHVRSEDNDEERRLLYVAMTRAKALLYLSCPLFSSQNGGERAELSSFVAPVAGQFAKMGSPFEHQKVSEIARILGKSDPPSQESIFKSLPPMFSPEDNMFPVDPENDNRQNGFERASSGAKFGGGLPPTKRQRLYASVTQMGGRQGSAEEAAWTKEYATTMEQAGSFTMASLPGFQSAAAHQKALSTALANSKASAAELPKARKQATASSGTAPRQKSLLDFATGSSAAKQPQASVQAARTGTAQLQQPLMAVTQPQPAIDPDLAAHKLSTGTRLGQRPTAKRAAEDDAGANNSKAARKQYPFLSSSPDRLEKTHADAGLAQERGPAAATGQTGGEPDEPAVEPRRAAACLHATTCTIPKSSLGAFRRPAGLTRGGIAPMETLRKPFKPLTLNRA